MKSKAKQAAQHSVECGVLFGLACTCVLSEPKVRRLHIAEKWALYRREVLVPSGIEKHPELEAHMKRSYFAGAFSVMSVLFKENMPTSVATEVQTELDEIADSLQRKGRL